MRKGAASFYIVAISTLILVIIAASFAAVIISEVTRSSNDDLSQSAYDSALAGVEDAKLTLYNYQKCRDGVISGQVGNTTCAELMQMIESGDLTDEVACDVVANALGRDIEVDESGQKLGVLVQEGEENGNQMQQYYTCVKITNQTQDVLGTLNSEEPEHSVRIRFKSTAQNPDPINEVAKVRLSWQNFDADKDRVGFEYMKIGDGAFNTDPVTPAVVSLGLVQTAPNFRLTDFDVARNGQTDRGTLYFVPQNTYVGSTDSYTSLIGSGGAMRFTNREVSASEGFTKSNDKNVKNVPFIAYCSDAGQDYACSVTAEIPDPIGGARNSDTFVFSVALPYGEPQTSYKLEFLDANNNIMTLDGVQISIDSTGRANDLFRRVDTRLEPADASYPYPIYGIQALDEGNDKAIWKDFYSTCEYNFSDPTC